jgi:hypothetical protein
MNCVCTILYLFILKIFPVLYLPTMNHYMEYKRWIVKYLKCIHEFPVSVFCRMDSPPWSSPLRRVIWRCSNCFWIEAPTRMLRTRSASADHIRRSEFSSWNYKSLSMCVILCGRLQPLFTLFYFIKAPSYACMNVYIVWCMMSCIYFNCLWYLMGVLTMSVSYSLDTPHLFSPLRRVIWRWFGCSWTEVPTRTIQIM